MTGAARGDVRGAREAIDADLSGRAVAEFERTRARPCDVLAKEEAVVAAAALQVVRTEAAADAVVKVAADDRIVASAASEDFAIREKLGVFGPQTISGIR